MSEILFRETEAPLDEPEIKKWPGAVRLAVIGGSAALGWGMIISIVRVAFHVWRS